MASKRPDYNDADKERILRVVADLGSIQAATDEIGYGLARSTVRRWLKEPKWKQFLRRELLDRIEVRDLMRERARSKLEELRGELVAEISRGLESSRKAADPLSAGDVAKYSQALARLHEQLALESTMAHNEGLTVHVHRTDPVQRGPKAAEGDA